MTIQAGTLLNSTALLDGTNFEHAVLLVTEYNNNGATGFVINKRFPRTLNELVEFSNSQDFSLYEGGPVEGDKLFFIHRRPDLVEGGTQLANGIYFGGNFKKAITLINRYVLTENDIKILIGYCGWDDQQLEGELQEGSWVVSDHPAADVFSR